MEHTIYNAGPGPSQQTDNADTEVAETPTSNAGNTTHAAEDQAKASLREAFVQNDRNRIDEIFKRNPILVNRPWITPLGQTPLHYACHRRLDDVVKHLLDRQDIEESFNTVDCEGFLPLHRAIHEDWENKEILDDLIGRTSESSLGSRTKDGDTVIHLASRAGKERLLDTLCPMLKNDEINLLNNADHRAIHEGIERWEIVKCLLRHKSSRRTNRSLDSLLHAAVAPRVLNSPQGFSTGQALLAEGVDLDVTNSRNNTPLHLVASNLNSHDDSAMARTVLRELLGLSQGVSYHDDTRSSLRRALSIHNIPAEDTVLHLIASIKLDDVKVRSSIHNESSERMWAKEVVECIVSVFPKALVSRDGKRNTPLHRACLADNWIMAEALLQANQTLRRVSQDIAVLYGEQGDMPMHLAVRKGHLETVKKLIAMGQSIRPILDRNIREETSVHVAADQEQLDILEEFLKRWPYGEMEIFDTKMVERLKEGTCGEKELFEKRCELRDKSGRTPLHIVAQWDVEDKAIMVFDQMLKGCPGPELVNVIDSSKGWTALHFAATRGHERLVELLLLNGADSQRTGRHSLLAADVARLENHIEVADFIRQYRSRSFRPGLEPVKANAEVDNHFLALSWPKWDETVRQKRGRPARTWPHVTRVNQLIFNTDDTYYKARPIGKNPEGFSGGSAKGHGVGAVLEATGLAPIRQVQIRLSSCGSEGWSMKDKGEFQDLFDLERVEHPQWQNQKSPSQVYLLDSNMFQDKERSTRWIHFPANNRAWVEDLCRCMYSHGSLRSELISILRFIDDSFHEVVGSQNYRYRKHGFSSQVLEKMTDAPPSGYHISEHAQRPSHREPPGTYFRRGDQIGDEGMLGDVYSAHSLVFPLLDMDNMDSGFCYAEKPRIKNGSAMDPQRSQIATSHQQISAAERRSAVHEWQRTTGRMRGLNPDSAPSVHSTQEGVMKSHWENMEALRERKTVHFSRSLDHYCHQRVSSEELQERVEDQVLTRFMKRQLSSGDTSPTQEETDEPQTFWSICSNWIKKLHLSYRRPLDPIRLETSLEKGDNSKKEAVGDAEKPSNVAPDTHDTESPLQILVVPQLCLWKIDNLVITSFPERWDRAYQRSTLLDSIRGRVEYLNIDHEVNPNRLVVEILDVCAAFQPTLTVKGQEFTWTDAFDDEILEVSRKIKSCYSLFQDNLGKSDERFSTAFIDPTKYLRSIDDVLDELTSIRRVFQDQLQVWEKVHTGDKSCVVCNGIGKGHGDKREGGMCPSNVLPKRSLELALRLEEDALKVRESVVTLLNLLQGEASTENALKASQQAAILIVFTIVTVVFTPLSWVTSLFALEVQSFPSIWTMKDLGLGSFFTLIVTLVLCAVSMLVVRSLLKRKENVISGKDVKKSCDRQDSDGGANREEDGTIPVS